MIKNYHHILEKIEFQRTFRIITESSEIIHLLSDFLYEKNINYYMNYNLYLREDNQLKTILKYFRLNILKLLKTIYYH